MSTAQKIQRAAQIAELRKDANDIARSARPAAVVAITRRGDEQRRLLLLLAQERRRRARLVSELVK